MNKEIKLELLNKKYEDLNKENNELRNNVVGQTQSMN